MEPFKTHVVGPSSNAKTLVFIHGWPDSAKLWDKQVERLSTDFRCVTVDLPLYSRSENYRNEQAIDFPEAVERLAETIQQIQVGQSEQQVILVIHDWGAFLGYLFEKKHPELVSRIVSMDVGGWFKPWGVAHAVFVATYQWFLSVAWLVGKVIPVLGDLMSRAFAAFARAPDAGTVKSRMNYFYFYLWRSIFTGRNKSFVLSKYNPQVPICYLYGKRKPFHFHSKSWVKMLNEKEGSRIEVLEKSGHWLMCDEPDRTTEIIRTFSQA